MTPVRERYTISGRVQGVGFRHFIATEARRLDLHGWVLNLPDGRVEMEAEGPLASVTELRRLAGEGPAGARVEEVQALPAGDEPLPYPFRTVWR